MFKDLPVVSSILGTTMCSSTLPSCMCRTHRMLYWSGSRPANANRSKSPITCCCWASVGASSPANAITPDVYLFLCWQVSINARVIAESPRNVSGAGRRVMVMPSTVTVSLVRYSVGPRPPPRPLGKNLMCISRGLLPCLRHEIRADFGQIALDHDQRGQHLLGACLGFVKISPPSDLVHVCANSRNLSD